MSEKEQQIAFQKIQELVSDAVEQCATIITKRDGVTKTDALQLATDHIGTCCDNHIEWSA